MSTPATVHDLASLAETMPTLDLSRRPTHEEAMASLRVLDTLNGCRLQLARFSGQPPWERHVQDELIYVLDGRVEVRLLGESEQRVDLGPGSLFVVPAATWHRSNASPHVTVLAGTPIDGNEHSTAEDPRHPDT